LENTDYRPPKFNKRNQNGSDGSSKNYRHENKSDKIDKVIACFKINDDFPIEKISLYKETQDEYDNKVYSSENYEKNKENDSKENEKNDTFRWSFDISNMHKGKNGDKYFILVAISHINVNEDMKETEVKGNNNDYKKERFEENKPCFTTPDNHESKDENSVIVHIDNGDNKTPETRGQKGIAIYRIELHESQESKEGEKEIEKHEIEEEKNYVLSAVTCFFSYEISGICKFIEIPNENDSKSLNDSEQKKSRPKKASSDDDSKSLNNSELKRFIILNFNGIYDIYFNDNFDFFHLNEKFEYPQSVRSELDDWYNLSNTEDVRHDCIKRLLSSIYDKYFLVVQYKDDVQCLEGINFEVICLSNIIKKYIN
jgi:hypothetical protein